MSRQESRVTTGVASAAWTPAGLPAGTTRVVLDAVVITRVVPWDEAGRLIVVTFAARLWSAVTYIAENGSAAAISAAIARLSTVRYSARARRRGVVGLERE
jgi:hypothetical protein